MYFEKAYLDSNKNDMKNVEYSLMSEDDHSFLCGLIEQHKPRRILEIGVYAGGSTVAMLDWLNQLGLNDSEIYSVDLGTSNLYGPTGFMIEELGGQERERCHLFTGTYIAEVVEKFKCKFDFAVIDTVHLLPGELLDFLACYPFLTEEAVVVLHDVGKNFRDQCRAEATKVLFDTVVGKKFWNWDIFNNCNIAAFQIDDDTGKYIMDVISALGQSWQYDPEKKMLEGYGDIIRKYYSEEAYGLFSYIIGRNTNWIRNKKKTTINRVNLLGQILSHVSGKIYLYGAGKYANKLLAEIEKEVKISGCIVSNDHKKARMVSNIPVFHLSDANITSEDIIINTIGDYNERENIRRELSEKGLSVFSLFDYLNVDEAVELKQLIQ